MSSSVEVDIAVLFHLDDAMEFLIVEMDRTRKTVQHQVS